jgi:hypothetical protein
VRRSAIIPLLLFLLAGAIAAGCSGGGDASAWLDECGQAVEDYDSQGGYLHFEQELEYRLVTEEGEFEQSLLVSGDIVLPDRETYEYTETVSSSQQPGQSQENAFSYLTLDGGTTAYVQGERLSDELGVVGWIHYRPLSDQNRYFDYTALMTGLADMGEKPEFVGFEDSGGERCAHLRYSTTSQELINSRAAQDPSFTAQFEGLDLGEVMGELSVELWIGEADKLPRQVAMDQSFSLEDSKSSTTQLVFVFSGYGEEPPVPIEAPAFANEAF